MEQENGIMEQMKNVPIYDAEKLTVENFNKAFQEAVEAKYPDYKENQELKEQVKIGPLEEGETIEQRRINNLQKVGINPYTPHAIIHFDEVKKYKSVWRAMRRGHLSVNGELFPNRPFNNRANCSERVGIHSRVFNITKQRIYNEYRRVAGN